jgi:hypothetical protein
LLGDEWVSPAWNPGQNEGVIGGVDGDDDYGLQKCITMSFIWIDFWQQVLFDARIDRYG